MDVFWRDGHFGVERIERQLVIGIFVVKWHNTFVDVKYVPMETGTRMLKKKGGG